MFSKFRFSFKVFHRKIAIDWKSWYFILQNVINIAISSMIWFAIAKKKDVFGIRIFELSQALNSERLQQTYEGDV